MQLIDPAPSHDDRKLRSDIASTLALHERQQLRSALHQRQRELSAALRLYEEVAIHSVPRAALIRRTQLALNEIGLALNHLDDYLYGTCNQCRQTLPYRHSAFGRSPHCDWCRTDRARMHGGSEEPWP